MLVLRRLFLFFIFVQLCHIVSAQAPDDVSINISAISLGKRIHNLKFENGSKVDSWTIYKSTRSEIIRYKGTPFLRFFHESGTLDANGEPVRSYAGSVELPRNGKDVLLVFNPSIEKNGSYMVTAIPDDLSSFGPGTYRFLNLTQYDMAIKIGENKKLMRRGAFTDLVGQSEDGELQETLLYSLITEDESEEITPYPSFRGSLFFSEQLRYIYVLTSRDATRKGKIGITVVPENIASRK